ncbi:hypothetical protein M413DRAFT_24741 [Hebeloma cylindrosporum]|uniref:Protein kinase domain-containing protein n=1 Tax=Hebeloma cylindrosporum TaxID=76867 RepID=A0A0C3CN57_HEBCY|nr:hypothetical protein M413DRAFT_24741 [Hebeloma cylindrosporum h7]
MSVRFHCYYPAEKPLFFPVDLQQDLLVYDLKSKVRELLLSQFRIQVAHDELRVFKAIVDYSKIISQEKYDHFREFCNFPPILVGVAETRIDISIAVCVGEIHVTKLLTLDTIHGFLASDNVFLLAVSFFFFERAHPFQGLVDLGNTTTAMYIATLNGTSQEVIVKFTSRYNEMAHCILADAKFAPRLHFCRRIFGGLYMVVMDRADGKSLWQLQADKASIPLVVLAQVTEAVQILHAHNLVFGDLRDSNILHVASEGRAVIVDFDWPGCMKRADIPPPSILSTNGQTGCAIWYYGQGP